MKQRFTTLLEKIKNVIVIEEFPPSIDCNAAEDQPCTEIKEPFSIMDLLLFSLHDSVVIHSTSGSDIHDGRAEVVFFYSVYCFFSGDWRHNTSEYS